MKMLSLVLVALLSACSLFEGPDASAAVQAAGKLSDIFNNQTMAFEHLVNDPNNGMTEQVRTFYQQAIEQNKRAWNQLNGSMLDMLTEIGSVDWQDAYMQLRDIYDQIRSSQGGQE